jgi:hypothetical protein
MSVERQSARGPVSDGYYNPDLQSDWYSPIVDGVKQLYLCKPTDALFAQLYNPDSVFEDPLGKLAPQIAFRGLAECFVPGAVERMDVIDVTREQIKMEIKMKYKIKPFNTEADFKATTILKLDEHQQICHHMDYWSGEPLRHAEDGFLGKLAETRRAVTGAMQAAFVKSTGGMKIGSQVGDSDTAATKHS